MCKSTCNYAARRQRTVNKCLAKKSLRTSALKIRSSLTRVIDPIVARLRWPELNLLPSRLVEIALPSQMAGVRQTFHSTASRDDGRQPHTELT